MASTPDDYGTSYYFRGAVENNYVRFLNSCWRIVRVTGDGSIKLALYDYSSASCTNTGDNLAFARYTETTYTTAFNTNNGDNAYVGFMYGATGASSYAATHANTNKSTILTNLETWYKRKESSTQTYFDSQLADTIWCNDKSTTGLGYGTNSSYYGASTRMYAKTPTLICPLDNNGGKLSKLTVDDTTYGNGALTYKIGLLTLDEMIYSGYSKSGDTTQYLYKNTGGNHYWSLSPDYCMASDSFLCMNVGGYYSNSPFVDPTGALRPSVSLISGIMIRGGDGTSTNPYIIPFTEHSG